MAFDTSVPFSSQQQNIANFLQPGATTALQFALPAQETLANAIIPTSTQAFEGGLPLTSGAANVLGSSGQQALAGVPGGFTIADLLQALGQGQGQTGINILTGLGTGNQAAATMDIPQLEGAAQSQFGTGGGAVTAGLTMQETGELAPGGQTLFAKKLNEQIGAIKGKYASLGMSGSTAEQSEIDQATQNSQANQFLLASQIGAGLVGQGAGLMGTGGAEFGQLTGLGAGAAEKLGGFGVSGLTSAGGLNTTLASLGFGGVGTAGALGSALSNLGLAGFGLSGSTLANIANEGLNQLGVSSGIFSGLAGNQLASDQNLTSAIGSFFESLGGTGGLFGTQGILSGVKGLLA